MSILLPITVALASNYVHRELLVMLQPDCLFFSSPKPESRLAQRVKMSMIPPMKRTLVWALALSFVLVGCTKKNAKPTIWIYTSIYKNVIPQIEEPLKKKFPNVDFQWFQSGSENVAARVNAELTTGRTQADLLMTSDPFWYLELKEAGHLMPYQSTESKKISAAFQDPAHTFVTVRMPVIVMARNTEVVLEKDAPQKWSDLNSEKWNKKVSMPSPLESGSSLLALTQLTAKYGWEYFEKLQKNGMLAAGGNSAVISRIETKERPVGIVLLENVLEAMERGVPIAPIYPKDGMVLVPSPVAITTKTAHPDLAKAIYDFLLTDEIQKVIVHNGRMYSASLPDEAPNRAESFSRHLSGALPWSSDVLGRLQAEREGLKKKFAETFLN